MKKPSLLWVLPAVVIGEALVQTLVRVLLTSNISTVRWLPVTEYSFVVAGALALYGGWKSERIRFGLFLVAGGAFANAITWLRFGSVSDYIPFFGWQINLADVAVTCGVIVCAAALTKNRPPVEPTTSHIQRN